MESFKMMMSGKRTFLYLFLLSMLLVFVGSCAEPKVGVYEGEKIYLTGDDMSAWSAETGSWVNVGDVSMSSENNKRFEVVAGSGVMVNLPEGRTVELDSKEKFGDIMAHIEFMVPKGSNSGVYFQGRYEIQILDSFGQEPKYAGNSCGGIYQRWDSSRNPKGFEGHNAMVDVAKPAGQWQSFDVIFRAPKFNAYGEKVANAVFERVVHNGVVVHENVELTGFTRAGNPDAEVAKDPLRFQGDHGLVAYRNVWVVRLDE